VGIKLNYTAPLLAAAAVAAAIVAAPLAAAAADTTACSTGAPGTTCVTPGNAQINDSLPPNFSSQYPDFSLFGLDHGPGGTGGHR
jgi:hypothetical protein